MKEFWHKHKIAILVTGGILLLLYLFYRYEQNAAANAANSANVAATTTNPYNVGGTPLVYGSDSGAGGAGATSAGAAGVPLGDYTGSTTAQQIPNTSSSGVPTTAPGNASTNALAPYVSMPSPAVSGAAAAQPYNTLPVTQQQASDITELAMAAVKQSSCAYALNGVNKTGVPTCGPGGYQFSGTGDLSTINPDVNGFFPGQSGYASAVQAQLTQTEQSNPGDTQDIANYEALLQSYGGISVQGSSEGSSVPAGGHQTTAEATAGYTNTTAPVTQPPPSTITKAPVPTAPARQAPTTGYKLPLQPRGPIVGVLA